MGFFYETIQAKGWDKFILSIENEFKNIREDLSIVERQDIVKNITLFKNQTLREGEYLIYLQETKSVEDIEKEFLKLREELNISKFCI